ncbi:MAG: hypothetical protein M3022_17275 [Actinomycetota bacterium]|nr:hypothetical protein [Actinomycetota bacterium]
MNCPRCGLSVGLRVQYLTLQHCPRCTAQRGISVPMTISEESAPVRPDRLRAGRHRKLHGQTTNPPV